MSGGLGCVVVADHEPPERFTSSLGRCNADHLPVTRVVSSTEALAAAAEGDLDTVIVLDPRIEFLRPFTWADVHDVRGAPLAFASEERERRVDAPDPEAEGRRAVREAVGLQDGRDLNARGLAVWSAAVVRSWRDAWLTPRGWTFDDALALCPDAGAWYLAWLLHAHPDDALVREPIVAVIDTPERVLDYRLRGITRDDLARGYVGVLTDGTAPWLGADGRAEAIGEQVSAMGLSRAALLRATRKAPRVQRWLGLSG